MTNAASRPVLAVRDLTVAFAVPRGTVRAVRGIDLDVRAGEGVGIVGESGSGKSAAMLAVMGLLAPNATTTGSVVFDEQELVAAPAATLRRLRGGRIGMIFQDPMTSLNPVLTVGHQLAEAVLVHRKVSNKAALQRAAELLDMVAIPHAAQRVKAYPHELSGGMRQRVMIAMAMANDPDLLIADEPTTALDVTIQAQILDVLTRLRAERNLAIVLITHDLGVVAGLADTVHVMYAGRVVEQGPVDDVFSTSTHPYTRGLLACLPRLDHRDSDLQPIGGSPPALDALPPGCAFAPRCPHVIDRCHEEDPVLRPLGVTQAACHVAPLPAPELAGPRTTSGPAGAHGTGADAAASDDAGPLLQVRDLVKSFSQRSRLGGTRAGVVQAVAGVSFDLHRGETLSLVGESGCGKSTTARCVVRIVEPTSGSVRFDGRELAPLGYREIQPLRRRFQMVFQDPQASLNPRQRVREIIGEPLVVHGHGAADVRERVDVLTRQVQLRPEDLDRFPHQFSGGQRQRIGIARALALEPDLVALDEPVSALDVSIQAEIVRLLQHLRDELGLAYLLIAHDLSVVRHISDRVAVMYLGKIVEIGTNADVYERSAHPYTQALLAAAPLPDPRAERARERIVLTGDVPSPVNPPSGCRFRTRCWKAVERCAEEEPPLADPGLGHAVACHFPEVVNVLSRRPVAARSAPLSAFAPPTAAEG